MLREHARAAVAHNGADSFAHFGLVAVIFAGVAAGFHVHFSAPPRAQRGVFVKLGARFANGFAAHAGA